MVGDRPSFQAQTWNSEATLLDYIDQALEMFSRRPAYTQQGKTLTYSQMIKMSRSVAAYLQAHPDLQPGDRVAVQLPNTLLYPVIAWGVLQAGMVIVNTNPQYTERETVKQLQDADVRAWFCADISAHLIYKVRPKLNAKLIVVCRLWDLHTWGRRNLYQLFLKYSKRAIRPYVSNDTTPFRKLLSKRLSRKWKRPDIGPHTLAMLQYTGGSSGVHKGAMLCHRNLVANLEQVSQFLSRSIARGEDIVIAPLPIYHIFCFTVHCAASLITGVHNILILDASHIGSMIQEIKKWPFACMTGVNTLFHSMMRYDSFRELNFSRLKFGIAGGMKLEPVVAERWQELTGKPILEGFGMTELSPIASWNPPEANRIGTIGKPMPFTEMRLLDNDGVEVTSPDSEGELEIRGPQVMLGYWGKPDETAKQMRADGWMRSGDLACFDKDGYWRIVGRKKRMILVSGFNVYPQEVEDVLLGHPDVAACHVVGVHHPVNGEIIRAMIVSRNKDLKAQDIREFCRKSLTSYKIPKQIQFHAELPPLP